MAAKTDTAFGDLVENGLRYAINGGLSVPVSDEGLRETANRLHSLVLAGDPTASVVWNQIVSRAAEHLRQEFLAAYNDGTLDTHD